jgi:hypothetical protein
VVGTLEAAVGDAAEREPDAAVRTAIDERPSAASTIAKQRQRDAADVDGERLAGESTGESGG